MPNLSEHVTNEIDAVVLNSSQRCDRCGAQAQSGWTRMVDDQPMDLLFCGHHTVKNTAVLISQGFRSLTNQI